MLTRHHLRSTTLIAAAGLALFVLSIAAPTAAAGRSLQVTRTLDYLHAKQGADGRFQDAAYTPWAIVAIAACGENPDGRAWKPSGRSPMDYLQGIDLEANMAGGTTANAPAYYAKMILAYVAAGRRAALSGAGSKRIDLVGRLLAHQRADGRVCPTTASDHIGAVNATIWSIIALEAAGTDAAAQARAVTWLKGQQLSDGGFANMAKDGPGTPMSDVDDTAAAVQALVGAGVPAGNAVVRDARAYLKAAQRSDGGFSSAQSGGHTYSESTAWVLQAILALGESPTAGTWTKNGRNVRDALFRLQSPNGSMQHRAGVTSTVMLSTTQCLVALVGRSFADFPRGSSSWTKPFAWAPKVMRLSPANGATLTTTTVLVKAAYRDGAGGTGIAASGVRLTVDGRDLTRQAKVTASSLSVKLTGATAGKHTIKVQVRDRAGNRGSTTHTFTVRSVSGSGGPASSGSTDSGSSPGSVASAASTAQGAQTGGGASGNAGATGAGGTGSGAGSGEADLSRVLDPVEGSAAADAPVAAFPSGAADTPPGTGAPDSGAAGGWPGSPQTAAVDHTGPDAPSDDRYALMLFGIGLVPVAVGFGIAGRYHRRWWQAIGRPQSPSDPPDGKT